jgi:hypothetical protein
MVGILDIEREDLLFPYEDNRFKEIDLLSPIKDKIEKSNELACTYRESIINIAGLSAPTGIGKTTFLVSLAVALARRKKEEGEPGKILIITPSKETRTEVMARLIEQVHLIKEKGLKPPKILVVFSKLDTCINNTKYIREVMDEIRKEEKKENPDPNIIQKLSYLFYNRCNKLVKSNRCTFYNNAQLYGEKIVETVIENGYLYIIGSLTEETVKRIKEMSTLVSKISEEEGVKLPYTVDVKTIAETYSVCPYELVSLFAERSDIIVMDSIYFNSHLFSQVKFIRDIVGENTIILVDETHELFRNRYPSIEVSEDSPLSLTGITGRLLDLLDEIITRYEIPEARYTKNGYEIRIAVPENSLDKKYITAMRSLLRRAKTTLGKIDQSKRKLVESDILLLEEALTKEPRWGVSDNANRGILAFMGIYKNGELVEGRIVPTVFSKKLTSGRDFSEIIHFSATLLPHHLSMLHHIRADYARELIATVKWDVIKENRRTVLLQVRSNYERREFIADITRRLIEKSGKDKVIIVAPLSWKEQIEKISKDLGYTYYVPKPVRTQEAKDQEVRTITKLLESKQKLILHISPHTSLGVGVNLVKPETKLDALVIAPSEAIQPPDSTINTEAGVVSRKYKTLGLNWWRAWFIVNVTRSILRVIQAVGRVQRSRNQKITIILIGRYFDKVLSKFYEPLFGSYEIVEPQSEDPEEISNMVIEVVKNG